MGRLGILSGNQLAVADGKRLPIGGTLEVPPERALVAYLSQASGSLAASERHLIR